METPVHQAICRAFVSAHMPQTAMLVAFLAQPKTVCLRAITLSMQPSALKTFSDVFDAMESKTGAYLDPLYIGSIGTLSPIAWFERLEQSLDLIPDETRVAFDALMQPLRESLERLFDGDGIPNFFRLDTPPLTDKKDGDRNQATV